VILIVDYGMGNLGSISNMLSRLHQEVCISARPADIARADKLILPGIGAFDNGMKQLHTLDLVEPLRRRVIEEGAPLLGICLGMQLLTQGSEEGRMGGLGWVDADAVKFDPRTGIRVPHMGWNVISPKRESRLFRELPENSRFYFVHSFYVRSRKSADVLASTTYGSEFTSVFEHGNILGVQFHPEKSHRFGMQLLRNFGLFY